MVDVNKIHTTMLHNIDDSYQKTEGFPTYDLTRGIAYGVADAESYATLIAEKQRVQNLADDELDVYIEERTGLTRKKSVSSNGRVRIVSGFGNILKGDLFSTSTGIQFKSIESKLVNVGDYVNVISVIGGLVSDVPPNTITEMPVTLPGISAITNDEATVGGYDVESDDQYRDRYYFRLRTPVNGVNKNQYMEWAMNVDGVGGAKCIPIWNGINTVKVIIVGNDFQTADAKLIKSVQDYIDPNVNGDGSGVATIGAVCTVASATQVPITVAVTGAKFNTSSIDVVKQNVVKSLVKYAKGTVFTTNLVSLPQVSSVILTTEGVVDFNSVTINGSNAPIVIDPTSCAVISEVRWVD